MDLKQLCQEIRKDICIAIHNAGGGHLGGCLSCVEVLAVLYAKVMNVDPKNPTMEGRDRLIVSKGHIGVAVYSTLAEMGFVDKDEVLATINKGGTHFPSHCNMTKVPGVDFSTGSLGQGFSAAVGVALGSKLKKDNATIYSIIGDGELQEGQIWEAVMFAAHNKLNNLVAFVDKNGAQIDGTTDEVCTVGNVAYKWRDFGWTVTECDGHDTDAILAALKEVKDSTLPKMIVLNTDKGYGLSFSQGKKNKCHHMVITDEMLETALKELQ